MYAKGYIISAVCHGGAIFPGITDKSTGKSIISGKEVTGFTTQGEEEEGVLDTIKSWNRPTIESSAASVGAKCKFGKMVAREQAAKSGRYRSTRSMGRIRAHRWSHCDWREPSKCRSHRRGGRESLQQALRRTDLGNSSFAVNK